MRTVVNYTALFIAAVYYRQLTVEQALDASNNHPGYRLAKMTRVVTVDMVRELVMAIERPRFSSFENIEKKLRVNERTLCKIYLLYKEVQGVKEKLTDEEIEYILRQVQSGAEIQTIADTFHLQERQIIKLMRKNGIYKEINSFTFRDQRRADSSIERVKEIKKYIQAFAKGESISIATKVRRGRQVKYIGDVVQVCDSNITVRYNGYNRNITVSDILVGDVRVKKLYDEKSGLGITI